MILNEILDNLIVSYLNKRGRIPLELKYQNLYNESITITRI